MKIAIVAGIVLVAALSLNGGSAFWNNYLSALYAATSAWQGQGIYGTYYSGRGEYVCMGEAGWDAGHFPLAERIVIRSSSGTVIVTPLNWTLVSGCAYFGTYHVGLQPGTYSVDTLSCSFQSPRSWGCVTVVPINVTVKHGVFTKEDLYMHTGIERPDT